MFSVNGSDSTLKTQKPEFLRGDTRGRPVDWAIAKLHQGRGVSKNSSLVIKLAASTNSATKNPRASVPSCRLTICCNFCPCIEQVTATNRLLTKKVNLKPLIFLGLRLFYLYGPGWIRTSVGV
ncbi:hypothetical protein, partial [Thermosynechococcus sp. M55_K2018_012]|uniref:hypothetical protein n=1 Tax=Thermosynechococcus sp. M55_K2018_012 TaxID=2747809 RepID=UPI0025F1978C